MQSDSDSTGSGWVKNILNDICESLRSLLLLLVFFLRVLVVLAVCFQQLVPPSEGGGVVAHEVHVMEVVETAAGVEWDQVERVPRDVVTAGRLEIFYKSKIKTQGRRKNAIPYYIVHEMC